MGSDCFCSRYFHRNPWISEQQQLECRESHSTNSSSSGRTYHQQQQHRGPGPPSSLWLPHSQQEPLGATIPYNHHQLCTGGHFALTDQIEGTRKSNISFCRSYHCGIGWEARRRISEPWYQSQVDVEFRLILHTEKAASVV